VPVDATKFTCWPADSLVKVFSDARTESVADVIAADACRNEFTSAQLAVRASQRLSDLRVSVSPLKHAETGATGVEVSARFVGQVPVKSNTPDTPAGELICKAPCLAPDPLLPDETIAVDAGETQPVWLTIFVPPDAPAGQWRGTATVSADGARAEVPVALTVHPVTLPDERKLWVTNWMNLHNFASHYGTELYSDRFWQVIEAYAGNMGAHRQNVVLCPNDLIHIHQEPDGRLTFGYADYDRWLGIFDRAGCAKLIEGGHLGRRGEGKWETPWFEWRGFKVRRRDGAEVQLDPEMVVRELVKSLVGHVKDRGWWERFVLHVVDEPAPHTEEDYRKKVKLVREWAPGVRLVEAMSLMDARELLDVWVPQLSHFHEHEENYLRMRDEAGIELWFYTCMFPTGLYPNRFLDFSLLKTRILHWINWRYRLPGYLHWGLNFWTSDPFNDDRSREDLPPGDCWIVYPGKEGPVDSIRWEQMREGIQDYELLRLLDERAREKGRLSARADDICAGLVPDPVSYSRSHQDLRAARQAVIAALIELGE
jgi:hypothetical protein